ncbi:MAG: amidase, partial [Phyllobacterium sp.]
MEVLTSHFLSRIQSGNPQLCALRFVDEEQALQAARAMDRRLAAGEPLPALAGVPVVVKENCDTAGMPCSAGLPFRANQRPRTDAPIISRLREAGAILLGVSVSDPGAFGVRTVDVTHPHDATLTVGGSSGGSAAALAAGYCLAAIGTDTGGSIRIPSACCGTVGLKPSFGSLPMAGIYPLVPSLDHVGPMANTVEDVRLVWQALGAHAPETAPVQTVGYDSDWVREAHSEIGASFSAVLETIARSGIRVKEIQLPRLDQVLEMHGRIFFVEGAAYHHACFKRDIPNYPPMARDWFEIARTMPAGDYVDACERRGRFTRRIDQRLGDVDLILTPTLPVLHPRRDACELVVSGRAV